MTNKAVELLKAIKYAINEHKNRQNFIRTIYIEVGQSFHRLHHKLELRLRMEKAEKSEE